MPDREKIIKELHDARRYLEDKEWSDRGASPHIDAINDALALLKKQDAVQPKKIKGFNQPCYVHYGFVCENCNTDLIYKQPYCAGCGRQVKWE